MGEIPSHITFFSSFVERLNCTFDCVIGKNVVHPFPMHFHDSLCIGLVTKGERLMQVNDAFYTIGGNEIFLANINEPHAILKGPAHDYIAITINGVSRQKVFCNTIQSEVAILVFNELLHSIQSDNHLLISKNWRDLYSLLPRKKEIASTGSVYQPAIQKAITFICENYQSAISIEDIANNVCMSTFYFSHIFKKETGISPYHYLIQYRLNMSYSFLKTSDSVFDTAIKTGFYDSSHFIKTFYSFMGTSPAYYKNSII